jgi:DNA-binding MarR family transcriptional regulator
VHNTIRQFEMKAAPSLLYLREEELVDGIELFFFAGRDFAKTVDQRLGELGLGRAHFRALHFVARHPGLPVSDLLGILGITKQSLSRVVKNLTDGGYLVQATGSRDRRQRLLRLTGKGAGVEAELTALQRTRFARAYREAGPEAVAGFRQVLAGLLADQERAGVLRLIAKR